ncbi:MAG: DNA repair protein RadA [Saprospiraceae bacterium]|nr:DNA repair protein RadA [Saprospiraceae bacterium]MBK9220819.1 DNA repair protein RadA [Saprospiraceae bacterium]MBK9722336.1 DNA repair protein RadA [Saprospiraceae bacterium]
MSKFKTIYVCSNCGVTSPKWVGKCPSCDEWNTYIEEVTTKETKSSSKNAWKELAQGSSKSMSLSLEDIHIEDMERITTGDPELDRALGGGLVKGSVTLLAGQPGIGKSTLLLQMALSVNVDKVLYVSGEESEQQIKLRAERIQRSQTSCFLYAETNILLILAEAGRLKPGLLIVDSVQTLISDELESAPGTISQIRECSHQLIRYAKENETPVFIIGHINKEGDIAGPKLLEHMVDTVLQFEGDRLYAYRMLRTLKNRFGSTDEMSLYEMQSNGLRPITNPSELLLSQHEEKLSGSAIGATMEGQRPLLIETQALVGAAVYSTPQRVANGFDARRMSLLLAVLEKRCGFYFGQQDVFLNLAGGIKISDPALDLAVIAAMISSLEDNALHRQICFAGEVGLSGEIRAVSKIEQRVQEAARLGFKAICLSKYNLKGWDPEKYKIKIVPLATVNELYEKVFSK